MRVAEKLGAAKTVEGGRWVSKAYRGEGRKSLHQLGVVGSNSLHQLGVGVVGSNILHDGEGGGWSSGAPSRRWWARIFCTRSTFVGDTILHQVDNLWAISFALC